MEHETRDKKEFLGRGWAHPVALDPVTGGIATAAYEDDIQQAIRIIIGTSPGERVMRPDFGCGVHDLVFADMDTAVFRRLEANVRETVSRYEARIDVTRVAVYWGDVLRGELLIELEYRIRRTNQTGNLVYPFYFKEGGDTARAGVESRL